MSTLLNSTINKLRAEAETMRVELAKVDASIEQLVKIQGGAVAAIKRRGKPAKAKNGVEQAVEDLNNAYARTNSAEAKDAALKSFM